MPSQESSVPVEVYGKPGCVQCKYTVKMLEDRGISHNYVDISINLAAQEQVKDMGFTTLPVVVAGEDKWSGFKLEKIRGIR